MRGITICVGYDDLLAISLPANLRHLDEVMVVTSPADIRTQELVRQTARARLHVTDAFYRDGATFRKGLAMEEGLDAMGREGWLAIYDADTVWPAQIDWGFLTPGNMYTPPRRMLYEPRLWTQLLDWSRLPLKQENEWAGYTQIFHGEDPRLVSKRPWYGTDWWHAGGCDSDFQQIWPAENKLRPGFEVLHLGPDCKNWCGRVTSRLDGQPLEDQAKRKQLMNRVERDWDFRISRLPVK